MQADAGYIGGWWMLVDAGGCWWMLVDADSIRKWMQATDGGSWLHWLARNSRTDAVFQHVGGCRRSFFEKPWWWNGRHEGLSPPDSSVFEIGRMGHQILCPNGLNNRGYGKMSALSERKDVEYRKFKEALTGGADGNLEPSFRDKEGAETRHDTSKESSL